MGYAGSNDTLKDEIAISSIYSRYYPLVRGRGVLLTIRSKYCKKFHKPFLFFFFLSSDTLLSTV